MWYVLFVLTQPLVIAAIVFVVWLLATRGRRTVLAPGGRAAVMRRVAIVGSIAVLVPYLAVQVLPVLDVAQRYLVPGLAVDFGGQPFEYRWWAYPLPLVAAIVVLVIVIARLRAENASPEIPVTPIARRAWSSFATTRDVAAAATTLTLLLVVSLVAGLASVPDGSGLHTLIALPGPDLVEDVPDGLSSVGVTTFFGWAYSVPVMVGAVLLALLTWWALRISSARPFRRPDTVDAETTERRLTATVLLRLVTAALLLPLGGALALIGSAGQGSTGVGIPGVGDFMWSLGYSSFAPAISILGSLLQAAAVVLLLMSIRGERASSPVAVAEPVAP